jgi:hypothetical protein
VIVDIFDCVVKNEIFIATGQTIAVVDLPWLLGPDFWRRFTHVCDVNHNAAGVAQLNQQQGR